MTCFGEKEAWLVFFLMSLHLTISSCQQPLIINPPKNLRCNLNSPCHFTCIAIPSLGVTIRWTKDNNIRVFENSHISIASGDQSGSYVSTLLFRRIEKEDGGSYRCQAFTREGSMTSDPALLIILGPPSVNVDNPLPSSISVSWHEPFNLQCKGEGTPDVTAVSWTWKAYIKGIDEPTVDLHGEHRRRVSDPNLKSLPREDDARRRNVIKYEVFCTVKNSRGSQRSGTTIINIRQKPGTPIIENIISLELGKAITLIWRPGSNPSQSTVCRASFDGLHEFTQNLLMQPIGPGIKKQDIAGLHPSTSYSVTIQCRNSVGKSNPSKPFKFNTKEGIPEVVKDVTVEAVNSTSLRVSWGSLPGNKVHGTLIGYKVKWQKEGGRLNIITISSYRNHIDIIRLDPGGTYGASVNGYTASQDGPYSEMEYVELPLFDEIFPPNITISKVFSNRATFIVQDVNKKDGAFTYCSILLHLTGDHHVVSTGITITMQPTYKDIGRLSPNMQYAVEIVCNSYDNKRVQSVTRHFRTLEGIPTNIPENLVLKNGDSNMNATWTPVVDGLNGNLTGYNVCIVAVQNNRHDLNRPSCFMTIEPSYTSYQVKPSNTYSVAVSACTKAGCGPPAFKVISTGSWGIPPTSTTPNTRSTPNTTTGVPNITGVPYVTGHFNFVYAGIAILVLAIIIVIVVIICKKRAKKPKGSDLKVVFNAENGEGQYEEPLIRPAWPDSLNTYADIPPPSLSKETAIKVDDVKFNCKQVTLKEIIGKGEFGRVYKGQFSPSIRSDESIEVAVKTMIMHEYDPSEYEEFVKEGLRMKDMDHPNVMKLIGICLPAESNSNFSNSKAGLRMSGLEAISPLVIVPYMPNGDLKQYLYNARLDNRTHEIGLEQLLQFAYDISCGMEYLSAKHIVHRDLACRNCMLDASMNVVVSDFGLSRQIYSSSYYVQKRAAKMPVKWMALESLMDRVYTSMTDVWAFGVTAWELFSFCQNPFPGVGNHEMQDLLKSGTRLNRPSGCPSDVWNDAIYPCWDPRPEERPTFTELAEMFAGFKKLHHHETGSESSENRFYVNVEPPDEGYEKLVSKTRGDTVSSENNEFPMPYESAVVRLPSGKIIPKRGRGSSKNPLIPKNSTHSDGSEDAVDL